jgi:hypothetical protein
MPATTGSMSSDVGQVIDPAEKTAPGAARSARASRTTEPPHVEIIRI